MFASTSYNACCSFQVTFCTDKLEDGRMSALIAEVSDSFLSFSFDGNVILLPKHPGNIARLCMYFCSALDAVISWGKFCYHF